MFSGCRKASKRSSWFKILRQWSDPCSNGSRHFQAVFTSIQPGACSGSAKSSLGFILFSGGALVALAKTAFDKRGMFDDPELRFTDEEAITFLGKLMPAGFAGADVLAELAPEGWELCGLVRAFHPNVEQWHAERVAIYENLQWLRERTNAVRRKQGEPESEACEAPPALAESREEFKETPIDAEDECREIVGRVLWEIFSDNHSVIADDGREVDIGSFRGASATLDAFDVSMPRKSGQHGRDAPAELDWAISWDRGDCMRFYMGLAFIARRTDFRPVYELVFRRLKTLGADWICRFPRENEAYRASAEAAAKAEPPPIVQAYRNVYGRLPSGWPPA
jgi:hypothetical protein